MFIESNEYDPNIYCISPNNASILLDMSCPIISFYSIAIERLENQNKINILITHHLIVDDQKQDLHIIDDHKAKYCSNPLHSLCDSSSPYIMNHLFYSKDDLLIYSKNFDKKFVKEHQIQTYIQGKADFYAMIIKQEQLTSFDSIKYYINMFIWDTFVSCELKTLSKLPSIEHIISNYEEFLQKNIEWRNKYIDAIMDRFYEYVWSEYNSPKIANFGFRFLNECSDANFIIYLFRKFVRNISESYDKTLNIQFYSWKYSTDHLLRKLKEEKSESEVTCFNKASNLFKRNVNIEETSNFYSQQINNFCTDLKENSNEIEKWTMSFYELPDILQDMILYNVWIDYGCIDVYDFGRASFFNLDKVDQRYWMNSEERINLMIRMMENI